MRTALRRDLTAAIKAKDRVAITALRSALAAIENAEAPPIDAATPAAVGNDHLAGALLGVGAGEIDRHELTDTELSAIVEKEIHDRTVVAAEYENLGRDERAARLRAEADVLARYR
jgi:hypothetical protein